MKVSYEACTSYRLCLATAIWFFLQLESRQFLFDFEPNEILLGSKLTINLIMNLTEIRLVRNEKEIVSTIMLLSIRKKTKIKFSDVPLRNCCHISAQWGHC